MSLDESSGESSFQSALQWAAYLTIQLTIPLWDLEENEEFKFNALYLSGLMGLLSLTAGQLKVTCIFE